MRGADQVELVDITPEALRRRMSHGNVYAADKVDAALRNYFRPGNLTALRELALLWLADQVDAALAKYRADHKITEPGRPANGSSSRSPAARSRRRWSGGPVASRPNPVPNWCSCTSCAATGWPVSRPRRLPARELAAVWTPLAHGHRRRCAGALLDFAREVNATQLVLGTSRRSRWARMFDEGIGAAVVQRSGKIDVHMVTHEEANGLRRWWSLPRRWLPWWIAALVVPAAVAALGALLDRYLDLGG